MPLCCDSATGTTRDSQTAPFRSSPSGRHDWAQTGVQRGPRPPEARFRCGVATIRSAAVGPLAVTFIAIDMTSIALSRFPSASVQVPVVHSQGPDHVAVAGASAVDPFRLSWITINPKENVSVVRLG